MKALCSLFLLLLLIGGDVITKYLVQEHLPLLHSHNMLYPYGGIGIAKNFLGIEISIVHAINTGAAWGIWAGFSKYLVTLRILFIIFLFIYLFRFNHSRLVHYFLLLALAGAIGNVIDFFTYGHVIDMLNFKFWGYNFPVFNLADSFISLGMVSLIILAIIPNPKEKAL